MLKSIVVSHRKIIKLFVCIGLVASCLLTSGCVELIVMGLVGGFAGSDYVSYNSFPSGSVGKMMNTSERKTFQQKLKNDPMNKETTWINKETGNRFKLIKTESYKKNDLNCYAYKSEISNAKLVKPFSGKACLQKYGTFTDD